jgi:hypothetical protein
LEAILTGNRFKPGRKVWILHKGELKEVWMSEETANLDFIKPLIVTPNPAVP